ncbi:restriction endonuclease subunit S [Candidatus Bipolaricaulota bacterium]|nr:restriction endonuclease subunit S [Candidatus Bipolaricaulota bacterium]
MGSEWRYLPFNEAVQINPSVPLKPGEVYPFVDMQAVELHSRTVGPSEYREFKGSGSRFADGDTLMARITPCLENGKIARFCSDSHCKVGHGSTEFIVIRGRAGVTDNDFAYYLTCWEYVRQYAISQMTGTSGRQRVPISAFSHLEVPIPPLSEQRAIAHILGTLDDKIELLRRMNETLEEIARALFKSWFVDFDPVIDNALEAGNPIPDELEEKAKRRLALGERHKPLPEHIRRLFPARFVDSELGPIPEGWECKQLGQLVSIVKGRSYKSSELAPSDTALVTLKSFHRGGGYKPDGLKPYTGKYSTEQVVKPGELVIALTDVTQQAEVIGKPAIVRQDRRYRTLVASLDTAIVRPLNNSVTVPFLYCLLRSSDFQDHAYSHCTGTTVLHLSKDALPTYQFACPPEELIAAYTRLSALAFSKIEVNQEEIAALGALRDTLLPKLISGEVRVRDAERILKE